MLCGNMPDVSEIHLCFSKKIPVALGVYRLFKGIISRCDARVFQGSP